MGSLENEGQNYPKNPELRENRNMATRIKLEEF
jgi:hypothetical protein